MLDSVTETTTKRVLHVDVGQKSRLVATKSKIRLLHGLGSAILTSAIHPEGAAANRQDCSWEAEL